MDPVAFHIFGWPFHWYGILVATGFMFCIIQWNLTARWENLPRGYGSEIAFWIMFTGIVGARIAHVLSNLDHYLEAPFEIFRIWEGGLIYYGGFVGAALAVAILARVRRMSPWAMGDYAICPIPLGHAIGRLGCAINGCCYGAPADAPWCITVEGVSRHPSQLYEALWNVVVYFMLLWTYRRKKRDGRVFAMYLMIYPAGRFALEFFRGDDRMQWLGLHIAQVLSVIMLLVGMTLWFTLPKRKQGSDPQHEA